MICIVCGGPRQPNTVDKNACRGACGACYRKMRAAGRADVLAPDARRNAVYQPAALPEDIRTAIAAGRLPLSTAARRLGMTPDALKRLLYAPKAAAALAALTTMRHSRAP